MEFYVTWVVFISVCSDCSIRVNATNDCSIKVSQCLNFEMIFLVQNSEDGTKLQTFLLHLYNLMCLCVIILLSLFF